MIQFCLRTVKGETMTKMTVTLRKHGIPRYCLLITTTLNVNIN
jgi:hypothetical protein